MKHHSFVRWCPIALMLTLLAGLAARPADGQEKPRSSSSPEGFALVRGGTFQMGDVWGDSPWAMPEVPVHEVQVDDFLLAKHEVTVAEFERFVAGPVADLRAYAAQRC